MAETKNWSKIARTGVENCYLQPNDVILMFGHYVSYVTICTTGNLASVISPKAKTNKQQKSESCTKSPWRQDTFLRAFGVWCSSFQFL